MIEEQFAPGWITHGFAKVNDVWIELGSVEGIHVTGGVEEPELSIHDVPTKLNELEAALRQAKLASR